MLAVRYPIVAPSTRHRSRCVGGRLVDQRELARRLDRMERVVRGHSYASGSALNLVERILVLLERYRTKPPGRTDSPGMRLVRAAIAALEDTPADPEYDRRFWAAIRAVLRSREANGWIDALL